MDNTDITRRTGLVFPATETTELPVAATVDDMCTDARDWMEGMTGVAFDASNKSHVQCVKAIVVLRLVQRKKMKAKAMQTSGGQFTVLLPSEQEALAEVDKWMVVIGG